MGIPGSKIDLSIPSELVGGVYSWTCSSVFAQKYANSRTLDPIILPELLEPQSALELLPRGFPPCYARGR